MDQLVSGVAARNVRPQESDPGLVRVAASAVSLDDDADLAADRCDRHVRGRRRLGRARRQVTLVVGAKVAGRGVLLEQAEDLGLRLGELEEERRRLAGLERAVVHDDEPVTVHAPHVGGIQPRRRRGQLGAAAARERGDSDREGKRVGDPHALSF